MAGIRRRVRAIALQALYEVVVLDEPLDDALETAAKVHDASEADENAARQLVLSALHRGTPQSDAAGADVDPAELERLTHAFVRHVGRIVAIQALYETESVDHKPVDIIERLGEGDVIPAEATTFARELVKGVLTHRREIDEVLAKAAPTWPVDQIAAVDRNILRLAIYEIILDNKTPVRAAINEAVELAKTFGSDNSAKFVNGVLGSVSLSAAGHA
jgi:N utilization substance protein B